MKYDREALKGRQWHKIVYWGRGDLDGNLLRWAKVESALESNYASNDYMARNGSGYTVIMLDEHADYIWLKLKLGIRPADYRGCGDWYNHKYSNGPGNRIPPNATPRVKLS